MDLKNISKNYLTDLVYKVNGAAIEVHKSLGPGLLENVYHKCMEHELKLRGILFHSELSVPVQFKGIKIATELRCDLFIENILPVELKSVAETLPIHEAQLLTYMKLLEAPLGLLINFNVNHIYTQGQQTFVNEIYKSLKDK